MKLTRSIIYFFLALCFVSFSVVFVAAQTTSANTSTRDFTDRRLFEAAIAGPSKTIGFGQILRGRYRLATLNPSIVGGITFSTPPGVSVDAAAANFYAPAVYQDDFIINSPNDRPDNKLTITLACPTLVVGVDFGGLGLKGASSATITLSNGHTYTQPTLPTVGHTTFVGFVSSDPITSLTLDAVNDSWVVLDVITATCTSLPNAAAPAPSPTLPASIRNRATITATAPPGFGKETMTNSCIVGTNNSTPSLRSTPLLTFLNKKPPVFFLLALDQNGNWMPWNTQFQSDSTFGNLASIPLRTAQSTYKMHISQDGILTIKEDGSTDSLIAGSGMSQLSGKETWGATETVDLKSGKDTLTFEANLDAHYIGGGGPGTGIPPGVATKCEISSHFEGTYSSADKIAFSAAPATPPPSLLTLANLSSNVYAGNTGYGGYRFVGNNCTIPPSSCSNAGLSAVAFASQDDTQIVIAVRGTVFSFTDNGTASSIAAINNQLATLSNIAADISFLDGPDPTPAFAVEVHDAAAFVQAIRTRYPHAAITLTGHSLGGAIVQLIGKASGLPAYGFNAPGAALLYPNLQQQLAPLSRISASPMNVNYRLYGDQVSLFGRSLGSTVTLKDPPYSVLPASSPADAIYLLCHLADTFLHLHTIDTVVAQIADNAPEVLPVGEPNLTNLLLQAAAQYAAGKAFCPSAF